MRVLITTTGTGGELFPGISVGEVLRERGVDVQFVISGLGADDEAMTRYRFPYRPLKVGRLSGEKLGGKVKTFLALPCSLWVARRILKEAAPNVVFGSGGYTAGPLILTSFSERIPRAILEPNATPGLTTRFLSPWAGRIYTCFPKMERFFPARKILWTGLPIRRGLLCLPPKRGGEFTVLLFGGSRGASSLNRAILKAMPILIRSGRPIRVIHQTGREHFTDVQKEYERMGSLGDKVKVVPFIQEMAEAYAEADLVVCRAGAATIAELTAVRRPAILVPFPFAARNHQVTNAVTLVEEGGAEMILDRDLEGEEGGERLAQRILALEGNRGQIAKMAEVLGSLPTRNAAESIADDLISLAKDRGHVSTH